MFKMVYLNRYELPIKWLNLNILNGYKTQFNVY